MADGIDQNCDSVDDCYADADGDAFGSLAVISGSDLSCANAGESIDSTDCNDFDASINPGATETVGDGIDQDCDSVDDCYVDADGDTYGVSAVVTGSDLSCANTGESTVSTDCDDTDVSVNPAATEIPNNGKDDDCNPATPDDDLDGDGQADSVDACPTTFTNWTTPLGDTDCDSFLDTIETFVGTDPLDSCANTATKFDEIDDRWPTDTNDDQFINVFDVVPYIAALNSVAPGPPYAARLDFNTNGTINVFDVVPFIQLLNEPCLP